MPTDILKFLIQAVLISLSGVMAPGPVAAATLACGVRRRHAGAWIAAGHGAVEFPLMLLIVLGAGIVFQKPWFQIGVGLAGGAALLIMGAKMLAGLRHVTELTPAGGSLHPFWTGIVLTAGNPYFLVWWATAGLALTTWAIRIGAIAFALFAVAHWLCDLIWLEVLSLASSGGVKLLGRRSQKIILAVCGTAMAAFGAWFLWDAVRSLRT